MEPHEQQGEAGAEGERVVVQKYGGSSVADPARLAQVAARVAATVRSGRRVVVVVSAMGKTTDQLLALAREVSASPPRREVDMLLSTGERISMALLAMALDKLGVEAISFTGSQSGILTNDRHSGARIIEVRPVRIQDEIARGKVVIVAGFQGMSYKREITTLGRGGSDTTAVALAAALGAEYCEICSDVDGVYSADPRVVANARRLDEIGYDSMQELAEHGAKVLHAHAVEWARRAGIVVHAVATAERPIALGGRGTKVVAQRSEARGAVAVAGSRRLVRVRVAREGEALLALLAHEGVKLRRFSLGASGAEALFPPDDVPDLSRVTSSLAAHFAGAGLLIDERGEVALVGPGVGSSPELVARSLAAARAVSPPEDPAEEIACEATPMRISLFLAGARVDDATRAVHAAAIAAHE